MSAAVVPLLLAAVLTMGAAPASAASRRAPSVSRIAPARGATFGGTRVTIIGRNFRQVKAVRFGNARGRKIRVLSPRKLRVIAPRHAAGTVAVRVIARSGGSRLTKRSRFAYLPPPAVGRVLPQRGFTAGGTAVTVIGRNFTAIRSVVFGAARGTSLRVLSPRKLRIIAPRHAPGPVDIRVIGAYGRSAARAVDQFTYLAPPPPPPAVGTWGTPAPIAAAQTLPVDGISCAPGTKTCVAIESDSAVVYDGSAWGRPRQVAQGGAALTSVSCASATFCLATDDLGNGYTWDGNTWTSGQAIATGDRMSSASCASSTDCGVVDETQDTIWVLTAAGWSNVGPNPGTSAPLVAVSCGPGLCWVVNSDSRAATLIPANIGTTTNPWAPGGEPIATGFTPKSLGCFGSFCAAGGAGEAMVTRESRTAWTQQALGQGVTAIDSVTCPVSGFCMATDQSGEYAVYTNAAWSSLADAGLSGQNWAGVSCSSATFCVAADDQGTAAVYTN